MSQMTRHNRNGHANIVRTRIFPPRWNAPCAKAKNRFSTKTYFGKWKLTSTCMYKHSSLRAAYSIIDKKKTIVFISIWNFFIHSQFESIAANSPQWNHRIVQFEFVTDKFVGMRTIYQARVAEEQMALLIVHIFESNEIVAMRPVQFETRIEQ